LLVPFRTEGSCLSELTPERQPLLGQEQQEGTAGEVGAWGSTAEWDGIWK